MAKPLPQIPDVCGDIDGYALHWGAEVVLICPTMAEASAARQAARDALAMLAACLAKAGA